MVTLMQCINDTVYTLLEHPCYATLSLSKIFSIKKKKNIKKTKNKKMYL